MTDQEYRSLLFAEYQKQKKHVAAISRRSLICQSTGSFDQYFWFDKRTGLRSAVSCNELAQAKQEYRNIKQEKAKLLALEMKLGIPFHGEFIAHVSIDDRLQQQISAIRHFSQRSCLQKLHTFLREEHVDTVFALYGVRRTGKTTMMFQAIADLPEEEQKKCAYLLLDSEDTFDTLAIDLLNLQRLGKTYYFLDEVTALQNFPENASRFADICTRDGITIVLSGTDSLKIKLASRAGLLGRILSQHTTRISFAEWQKLQEKSLHTYIQCGGILSEPQSQHDVSPLASPAGVEGYILSAICDNIVHSMDDWQDGKDYQELQELRDAGELTHAIQKVIAQDSHAFTLKALRKTLKANDLGLALQNLRRQSSDWDIVSVLLQKEHIKNEYLRLLHIKPESSIPLTEDHAQALRNYFFDLDLLLPSSTLIFDENRFEERNVLVFPGIRWHQAEVLIQALLADPSTITAMSPSQTSHLVTAIRQAVEGRLLEEILIRDISMALASHSAAHDVQVMTVHRKSDGAELDIVVRSLLQQKSLCFEVKNSDKAVINQGKWLYNKEFMEKMAYHMGDPLVKCVLYHGGREESDGILWRNAELFLSQLQPEMTIYDIADLLRDSSGQQCQDGLRLDSKL